MTSVFASVQGPVRVDVPVDRKRFRRRLRSLNLEEHVVRRRWLVARALYRDKSNNDLRSRDRIGVEPSGGDKVSPDSIMSACSPRAFAEPSPNQYRPPRRPQPGHRDTLITYWRNVAPRSAAIPGYPAVTPIGTQRAQRAMICEECERGVARGVSTRHSMWFNGGDGVTERRRQGPIVCVFGVMGVR
jgi:hypothetical protein